MWGGPLFVPRALERKGKTRFATTGRGLSRGFEVADQVARHQIDLEIERAAELEVLQRRDFARVWNQHHAQGRALHGVDGERHAVERDRALLRQEAAQLV